MQSIPWREMRDAVMNLAPTEGNARQAIDLLGPWDGRVEVDSLAAAVFLILELEQHFEGLVKIPTTPLRDALLQLGR